MLKLDRDGAELVSQALSSEGICELQRALEIHDLGRPGARLNDLSKLGRWLSGSGIIGQIVAKWSPNAMPVRAILFDKNPNSNWALGWHQDRTIAVAGRIDTPGFNNWNRKDGIDHVEPPFDYLERMITVRVHLDDVSEGNAPLLISPGTHLLGRIVEQDIDKVVARHGTHSGLAKAGDVWVYRTPILHASKRATSPARRRVLQVDYSADELPGPLQWFLKDRD